MDYIVSEDQIDSILKRYFDKVFSNADYLENIQGKKFNWTGFFKKGSRDIENFIIGYSTDDPHIWFSNGNIFSSKSDIFDISTWELNNALKRYLNKNYNTNIETVI
jgi:hypothetical protein